MILCIVSVVLNVANGKDLVVSSCSAIAILCARGWQLKTATESVVSKTCVLSTYILQYKIQ
jgi:hypothetical protein